MEMKTGVSDPTTPPTYSETIMTSPQPTPMIPPPLPPNHQDMPHPSSPSPYQPEPTSNIHNPPYHVPLWVTHQPPIGIPDTSFTEIPIAQQHPSDQNNPTVVHVVKSNRDQTRLEKCQGCCFISVFLFFFFLIGAIILIIFFVKLFPTM